MAVVVVWARFLISAPSPRADIAAGRCAHSSPGRPNATKLLRATGRGSVGRVDHAVPLAACVRGPRSRLLCATRVIPSLDLDLAIW